MIGTRVTDDFVDPERLLDEPMHQIASTSIQQETNTQNSFTKFIQVETDAKNISRNDVQQEFIAREMISVSTLYNFLVIGYGSSKVSVARVRSIACLCKFALYMMVLSGYSI